MKKLLLLLLCVTVLFSCSEEKYDIDEIRIDKLAKSESANPLESHMYVKSNGDFIDEGIILNEYYEGGNYIQIETFVEDGEVYKEVVTRNDSMIDIFEVLDDKWWYTRYMNDELYYESDFKLAKRDHNDESRGNYSGRCKSKRHSYVSSIIFSLNFCVPCNRDSDCHDDYSCDHEDR